MTGNAGAADFIFPGLNPSPPLTDQAATLTTQGAISEGASTGTGTLGGNVAGAEVMRRGAVIVIGATLILVLFGTVLFKEARLRS